MLGCRGRGNAESVSPSIADDWLPLSTHSYAEGSRCEPVRGHWIEEEEGKSVNERCTATGLAGRYAQREEPTGQGGLQRAGADVVVMPGVVVAKVDKESASSVW